MKSIFGLFLMMMLLSSIGLNAQKLGHINSADLLQMMPESKVADSALVQYKEELVAKDSMMQVEYERMTTRIGDHAALSDSLKKMEQDLVKLQSEIQEFESSAQDQIEDKKRELYEPIIKKATEAVKAVGGENGYTYIFDASDPAIIYASDAGDIMTPVKKKLGLK